MKIGNYTVKISPTGRVTGTWRGHLSESFTKQDVIKVKMASDIARRICRGGASYDTGYIRVGNRGITRLSSGSIQLGCSEIPHEVVDNIAAKVLKPRGKRR